MEGVLQNLNAKGRELGDKTMEGEHRNNLQWNESGCESVTTVLVLVLVIE